MILEINEEQALQILSAQSFCCSEGQARDLDFLYPAIKKAFPELWEIYKRLESDDFF